MAKRALVMSGGGAKGAFQLGAVDFLVNDRDMDFDVIAGVSVGSLNASLLAQGHGLDGLKEKLGQLKDLWFGITGNDDVARSRFLGQLLVFVSKDSIFDPTPLREKLARHLDEDALRSSGKEFRVGAVELESGDYVSIEQSMSSLADWTLASSSMPLAFPPVEIAGKRSVDGGVRNITPLRDALAALKVTGGGSADDPDEVYVLLATPLTIEPADDVEWKHGREIGERALTIITNEVFREDLKTAIQINRSVRIHQEVKRLLEERDQLDDRARRLLERFPYRPPKYRPVTLKMVVPEKKFMEVLEFDPAKIREAFTAGREAAETPRSEEEIAAIVT